MSPPTKFVTEAEVRVLINDMLKPFHEQNLVKFDAINASMGEIRGAIKTAGWIIGIGLAIAGILVKLK